MNAKKILVMIFMLCATQHLYGAVTAVYNLRMAETTKRDPAHDIFKRPSIATVTLFDQWRKKGDETHEVIGGPLLSYNYLKYPFYFRVDFAFANASQEKDSIHFSRTQTDDLLFSAGYDYALSELMRFTFSGLLGIPTHKDDFLTGVQFGYAHVGLGAQIDGSFGFDFNPNQSIRTAARYIRFFPRTATQCVDGVDEKYTYNPGNLADMFVSLHNKFGLNRLEFGYNPSFLFGSTICPEIADFATKNGFIRNSFYGNYKRLFYVGDYLNALQASISYGFDIRPKFIGRKRIINIWGSWIINF